MKRNSLIAGLAALFIAGPAFGQVEITITGATAFRQATMQAIYNAYDSIGGGIGNNFNVAHDFPGNTVGQLIASNKAIFRGNFPGLGETIIRTSFNGSTQGLNAIAGNNNPPFFEIVALPAGITGSFGASTENFRPKFSFSDVYQSTSPVQNEVLNPVGASFVGVVTFAMVANVGAPANWDNITIQQCRALWQQGIQPLSLMTGDPADNGRLVFATGRNDGSGTRSAYLTEWTYGVANAVNQYIATTAGLTTPGQITAITLVPQGGNSTGNLECPDGTGNRSELWGNDVVGNGGFRSNSGLRGLLQRSSTNVTVYDGEDQTPILTNVDALLVSWISTADALQVSGGGGKVLAFNGVKVTPISGGTGFNAVDTDKIANGSYSAWSYQHLYHHGSLNANEAFWRNSMVTTWLEPALLQTANGLPLSTMNVERPDDGFPIVAF